MTKLRVAFRTVGCRANQADTAWLARRLDPAAVVVVSFDAEADVYVVNSCAVTAAAERDVRKALRRACRRDSARVALTGCMVGASAQAVAALGPLWRVVPSWERGRLVAEIHELAGQGAGAGAGGSGVHGLPGPLSRARPSLRIQDGCERRCAYCAVPAGRGPERSLSPAEVFSRLEVLAREGATEVVVCGVNLGRWGRDLTPRSRLSAMAEQLEARAPVDRIRLSSIEPWTVDARLVRLYGEASRIAPHVHLPLQSGDDGVLRRMGRPYRRAGFEELVASLLSARPDLAVGLDVLVGFPGEDDAAFEHTLALVERLPVAYLHVFGYSPRPGTVAAGMTDQVPGQVKRRRVAQLRELGAAKSRAFAEGLLGRVLNPVLEPPRQGEPHRRGVSEWFVPVRVAGDTGEGIVRVRGTELNKDGSVGCEPC